MKVVDTNVLARFLLRDDVEQAETATAILREPFWVAASVWVELGWVLTKRLRLERGAVGDALETLLLLDTLNTADREGIGWAVQRFRAGADWADMIHLVSARGTADGFLTFDRSITRYVGTDVPLSVEVVR